MAGKLFSARDFLKDDPIDLLERLPTNFDMEFDDGSVVRATRNCVYFSRFFWEIHVKYPKTPLLKRHYVGTLIAKSAMNSSTHTTLMSTIRKDTILTYKMLQPQSRHGLDLLLTHAFNRCYNQACAEAEEFALSVDYLDFLEIADHPPIRKLIDSCGRSSEQIRHTYAEIIRIMKTDDALDHNPVIKSVRSNTVNANQILQCIAFRGDPSEVDGTVYENTIKENYTLGMQEPFSYFAESRSAHKSLLMTESPLQQSEYFARRLQIATMVVRSLAYEDCGTTDYVEWTVNGPRHDDQGTVVYPGDLEHMVGKYYFDEDMQMHEIQKEDTHLYGQTIRLRTALNCRHPDPHKVCMHCFGSLHYNVSPFSNLGHLCSATMTQQASQSVLSNKHLDSSSIAAAIILTALSGKYFSHSQTKKGFVLQPELKDKVVGMRVAQSEAYSLIDVQNLENPDDISPARISSISSIDLLIDVGIGEIQIANIPLRQANRDARLTKDFLLYVREKGWLADDRGFFEFDLRDWDFSKALLRMPAMEYSYSDHADSISDMIESNVKAITQRRTPGSPAKTLKDLFELVNSKLKVNIAALEVILYAFTVQSPTDYRLGRNAPEPILGIGADIIKNRSESAALCYESQHDTIYSPKTFFPENRPNVMFDVYFCPDEVVKHYASEGLR